MPFDAPRPSGSVFERFTVTTRPSRVRLRRNAANHLGVSRNRSRRPTSWSASVATSASSSSSQRGSFWAGAGAEAPADGANDAGDGGMGAGPVVSGGALRVSNAGQGALAGIGERGG
jgi:hypothetical protein